VTWCRSDKKDFSVAVAIFFGPCPEDRPGVKGRNNRRQTDDLLDFAVGGGDFEGGA